MTNQKERSVFVLMPFDPEFQKIYELLIKPALEEIGYRVSRADSFLDQQNIMRDIINGIARADLVIADLTTVNANVFYELGLCHGLGIPTVMIAQNLEEVPFDLRPYKIQPYETRFDKIEKLKSVLTDIGERHKTGGIQFGSPIVDFFPNSALPLESNNNLPALLEEDVASPLEPPGDEFDSEEKGVLDYSADIETGFDELNRIIAVIQEENEKITAKAQKHAEHFQELNANPTPGSAAQKQKIGLLIASDMNLCAKRFEQELPNFEAAIMTLDEGSAGLMALALRGKIDDKQQVVRSREQFASFLEHTVTAISSFSELRDTVAGLTGISKDVNRASRRLAQALDGIVQNFEGVKSFGIRTVALIDQWIEGNPDEQR